MDGSRIEAVEVDAGTDHLQAARAAQERSRRLAQAGRKDDVGVDARRYAPEQPAGGAAVVQARMVFDVADDARPGASERKRHRGTKGVADVEVGVQQVRPHLRERRAQGAQTERVQATQAQVSQPDAAVPKPLRSLWEGAIAQRPHLRLDVGAAPFQQIEQQRLRSAEAQMIDQVHHPHRHAARASPTLCPPPACERWMASMTAIASLASSPETSGRPVPRAAATIPASSRAWP